VHLVGFIIRANFIYP